MGANQTKTLLASLSIEPGDDGRVPPLSVSAARKLFAAFDVNRDGVLDRGESIKFIGAYLRAHGEHKPAAERVLALLAAIDKNGDGCVDFSELTGQSRSIGFRGLVRARQGAAECGAFTGVALLVKIEIVQLLEREWLRMRRHHGEGNRPAHPYYQLRLVCRAFRALVDDMVIDGLLAPPSHASLDVTHVRELNYVATSLPLTVAEIRRTSSDESWFPKVDAYISEMSKRIMARCSFFPGGIMFVTDADVVEPQVDLVWTTDGKSRTIALSDSEPLGWFGHKDPELDVRRGLPKDMWQRLARGEPLREVLKFNGLKLLHWDGYSEAPDIKGATFDSKTTIQVRYNNMVVGHVTFQPVVLGALRSELQGDKNFLTVAWSELEAAPAQKAVPLFFHTRNVLIMRNFTYDLQ